jgi:hypothetical protein
MLTWRAVDRREPWLPSCSAKGMSGRGSGCPLKPFFWFQIPVKSKPSHFEPRSSPIRKFIGVQIDILLKMRRKKSSLADNSIDAAPAELGLRKVAARAAAIFRRGEGWRPNSPNFGSNADPSRRRENAKPLQRSIQLALKGVASSYPNFIRFWGAIQSQTLSSL